MFVFRIYVRMWQTDLCAVGDTARFHFPESCPFRSSQRDRRFKSVSVARI